MLEEMLRPVDPDRVAEHARNFKNTWGAETQFPTISELEDLEIDLAVVGVPSSRDAAGRQVTDGGTDRVRRALYTLAAIPGSHRIADLGDILPGETARDTRFAVREITDHLLQRGILPLFIGGGQEMTLPIFEAFELRETSVNLVSVDTRIDIMAKKEVDAVSWIWHILDREPSWLFNFTQIAYQSHFVPPGILQSMDKLHFDHWRLGVVRENIRNVEPAVRDADIMSFDMSSVRVADSPGHSLAGPNGLFGEEACQIARYAGMSDKLTCFGVFGYEPDMDRRGQSAMLVAQLVWYFVEGYYNRKGDVHPVNEEDYMRYRVVMDDNGYEMNFLKSLRSGRWWMEIPFKPDDETERHALLPCTYEDYEIAQKQEVPDRWLKAVSRLNV